MLQYPIEQLPSDKQQRKRTKQKKHGFTILYILMFGILGGGYSDVEGWTPGVRLTAVQIWPHPRPGDWNAYNRIYPSHIEGCGSYGVYHNESQVIFRVNLTLSDTDQQWMYGPPLEDPTEKLSKWYHWPDTIITNGTGQVTIMAEENITCWREDISQYIGFGNIDKTVWMNYTKKGKSHNVFNFALNQTGLIVCSSEKQVEFLRGKTLSSCDNSTGTVNGTGQCCGTLDRSWGKWGRWLRVYQDTALKVDPGHLKKIPTACVKTGTQSQKTVASVIVTFPPDKPCSVRNRRAWYDTILGGVGAIAGTLNSFDIETLANRMSNTGRGIQDALTLQGQWLPTVWHPWKQALQIDSFLLQMKNASDSFMFKEGSNITQAFNWTVCTLQTIYQMQQKATMQTQLMTGNEGVWRTVFDKTIPGTSWLKIEAPKMLCNDTACQGIINLYNVTNQQIMCRYVVLPLLLGMPGNQWFWMPKMNGLYIDNNNRTHDLSLCEDTLEGNICRLHSAMYEPCLLQGTVNVCEITILPTTFKMLVEIGPQEICVVTDTPVVPGMRIPFVGCLQNVSTLIWENQTFLLTHDKVVQETVRWRPVTLPVNNWDLNLTKLKEIIEKSEGGRRMIEGLNKTIQQHVISTTIVAGKIVKMGSVIADATSHHWYDIFLGYSPSAKKMLDWVIHPLLVVMVIVIILSIWNCYMAYKVFCRRPKVLMVTYGNGK
ncbi:uncharacterized protein LOC143812530 isoform X2 [Ranitomeya variabilis]|uniref:uncharacterized protein LOC143812530 isoform X2 n=1 Tax=Ranitomeya variabilis TaxID=490064 RepID=UPI004057CB58